MVLNYYKLAAQPFGVTPDPRFLYLSQTHREALASVLYGAHSGRGFMTLIAKPGMGKTTLLFHVLESLQDSAKTVFIFQTRIGPRELIKSVLTDLSIQDNGIDVVDMYAKINQALLEQSSMGKRFVLIIDEAQNLEEPVLEVVRMLSNFETPREKLMQIVLAGQPQLAERLASPRLIQLRQRISIVARLAPLSAEETRHYIEHRLRVAGCRSERPLFSEAAYDLIAQHSEGIPRNISNICFNAMSIGCVMKQPMIGPEIIREVLNDLDLSSLAAEMQQPAAPVMGSITSGSTRTTLPAFSFPEAPNRTRTKVAIAAAVCASALMVGGWYGVHANGKLKDILALRAAAAPAGPNLKESSPSASAASRPAQSPNAANSSAETVNSVNSLAKAPVVAETGSSYEGATTATQISVPSRAVPVEPNDTLYRIVVRNYGKFDKQLYQQILDLNPSLTDPNHIVSGQVIRIPVIDTKRDEIPAAGLPAKAPVNGMEKP